jgi:hypothetical protein
MPGTATAPAQAVSRRRHDLDLRKPRPCPPSGRRTSASFAGGSGANSKAGRCLRPGRQLLKALRSSDRRFRARSALPPRHGQSSSRSHRSCRSERSCADALRRESRSPTSLCCWSASACGFPTASPVTIFRSSSRTASRSWSWAARSRSPSTTGEAATGSAPKSKGRRAAAAFLALNDETAQGPFRTRGMGRWVAMNIGGRHGCSLPRSRENEGRPEAPLEVGFGSRYGVGSGYEPPKMSVLPNVAGQSCCGAGRFRSVASPAAVPFTTACR